MSDSTTDGQKNKREWLPETGYSCFDDRIFGYSDLIGPEGIAIYAYLCMVANKDGQSWWSIANIAKHTNTSKPTVRSRLKLLRELSVVDIQIRFKPNSQVHDNNLYTLHQVPQRPNEESKDDVEDASDREVDGKGDFLPVVKELYYRSKLDLPGVVKDLNSNKTQYNETQKKTCKTRKGGERPPSPPAQMSPAPQPAGHPSTPPPASGVQSCTAPPPQNGSSSLAEDEAEQGGQANPSPIPNGKGLHPEEDRPEGSPSSSTDGRAGLPPLKNVLTNKLIEKQSISSFLQTELREMTDWPDEFVQWWQAYPERGEGCEFKAKRYPVQALIEWMNLRDKKPELYRELTERTRRWAAYWATEEGMVAAKGRYIPQPHNFLAGRYVSEDLPPLPEISRRSTALQRNMQFVSEFAARQRRPSVAQRNINAMYAALEQFNNAEDSSSEPDATGSGEPTTLLERNIRLSLGDASLQREAWRQQNIAKRKAEKEAEAEKRRRLESIRARLSAEELENVEMEAVEDYFSRFPAIRRSLEPKMSDPAQRQILAGEKIDHILLDRYGQDL